jgi:hypothetical protein
MLEKEYEYFLKNKKYLQKKYIDKYIVIKNEDVVGSYESQTKALEESLKFFELGTFLIQRISKNEFDVIQYFYSPAFI